MSRRSVFLVLLLTFIVSCSKLDRLKQERTFADMQTIVGEIEALRVKESLLVSDTSRIRRLISGTAQGRDAWQHKYLFFTKAKAGGLSYVLVSTGSDGKQDFIDTKGYFALPERVMHGEAWRDIVFRDGQPVTRAGK